MLDLRRMPLTLGFLSAVIALPALAQPHPAAPYPAACDASKVTKADVDRAHTVFLSGKQYLEESNYDKAIEYFTDAYSIDCSTHAILPAIATAYERKGDKGEAIRALEEYLSRAPSAPDREVVERRIKNLKDQLAREAPPPPSAPTTSAGVAPAAPSASALEVSSAWTSSSVAPAASLPSAAPLPPGAPEARHGAAPWIVVGVGAAAIVAGAVIYGLGQGDVSSASSVCPVRNDCNVPSARSKGNSGRDLLAAGGATLGGGAALVAAGLVWHFLEGSSRDRSAAIGPALAPGYAGLGMKGEF
ncbi:MAG: tetratricopeptide repeat protein [Polyangiaceae bacterium]|jgi:tetratricopeptide (TPR) repeat protein